MMHERKRGCESHGEQVDTDQDEMADRLSHELIGSELRLHVVF